MYHGAKKGFQNHIICRNYLNLLMLLKMGTKKFGLQSTHVILSDVLPNEYDYFKRPKIFILEGINTLQATPDAPVYLSDFFDFVNLLGC